MLSIIVPWRNRQELVEALPSLARAIREVGGNLLLVNFGGDVAQLNRIRSTCFAPLRVVDVHDQPYFNKGRAANLGAVVSESPYIFVCDCDIVLPSGLLGDLLKSVSTQSHCFATLRNVKETAGYWRASQHVQCYGYHLHIRTRDGRCVRIVENERDAQTGTRQAPGLLLIRRSHFLQIRGYNGNLHGWGWQDQDMICRLSLGLGLERIELGTAAHISHDDLARVENYPITNRWESRARMFGQALENYDKALFFGTLNEDRDIPWHDRDEGGRE